MKIIPFSHNYLAQTAGLFIENYSQQCLAIPDLPVNMLDQSRVEQMLIGAFGPASGLVAIQDDKVLGYLCWFLVDHFRNTSQKGAYVPEWGHACFAEDGIKTYRVLYRMAGEVWAAAGCQVHAITLLAGDRFAEKAWYWNGFGLAVVDAIRPMRPLEPTFQSKLLIRMATPVDIEAITQLDAEHWRHYSRSPIFMAPRPGKNATENLEFLSKPKNSIWLAEDGNQLAGFIRFEADNFDSAAILKSEDGVTITGAYVRLAYRGQKLASALLDAALRYYQSRELKYCAVNFESFNPEAASFWMHHFEPVCYSLMRFPES